MAVRIRFKNRPRQRPLHSSVGCQVTGLVDRTSNVK